MKSLIVLAVIVLIGAGVGWAGGQHGVMVADYPVSVFLLCSFMAFAINWLAFIPSNAMQSEKFYDLTGSLTYVLLISMAVYWASALDMRAALAAAMVLIWTVRLGAFLFVRISQDGQDDRFDQIKVKPLRFFTAWTIQGLWVLLTASCALVIITSNQRQALGWVGSIGAIIWVVGFLFEVIADRQKREFRKRPENKERFISKGLWAWSQHPNYFGEIIIWIGMAVMALPVLEGWQYVCLISPLFVIFLLTKVSGIPLLQKKGQKKWGDDAEYQAYLASTSLLIPLPPKRPKPD